VTVRPAGRRWWTGKVRQFGRHIAGRVSSAERAELDRWLTPAQLALFDAMHRVDQRHGLDVVAELRREGHDEPELLLAGLLHDCGKGSWVGLWHRVGWSLADRYGQTVRRALVRLPGFERAFVNLDHHPQRSAELCLAAGCGERVAELVRNQAGPGTDRLGEALRLADEAS
jgi:hypothetical protein